MARPLVCLGHRRFDNRCIIPQLPAHVLASLVVSLFFLFIPLSRYLFTFFLGEISAVFAVLPCPVIVAATRYVWTRDYLSELFQAGDILAARVLGLWDFVSDC